MNQRQIHAQLIAKGSNFRIWAELHGYNPRTVTQVVTRWAGKSTLPRGRIAYQVLQKLSRDLGEEIIPGILEG